MSKIYTIAKKRSFPGQGGGYDEQMICKTGSYGSGSFPPFFKKREFAEQYNESLKSWDRGEVVECFLEE